MVLLLLLLIPLRGVISDIIEQTLSATCGDSILFHVNVPSNIEIHSIFWSSEKGMLAIAKSNQLNIINTRFRHRVNSENPSFSLKLSNLNEEDSGIYKAKIFTSGDTMYRSFKLHVYAKSHSHGVQCPWWNISLIISLGTLALLFNVMTL